MDPIVKQTLTLAHLTEVAARASAVARREEIAADLVTQDALIQVYDANIAALSAALPAEEEPTE